MSKYRVTVLAVATIILSAAHPADAASPSASIVSPASPLQADQLQRLEFVIQGMDTDNDLRLCEMYVDGIAKGSIWFDSPNSGAEATWTYAFGTPGTHTVVAQPVDLANNHGEDVTWSIEVTEHRQSLGFTVMTYNTHLFGGVSSEWLLYIKEFFGGEVLYEDVTRRDRIVSNLASLRTDLDMVALQEVWAYPWQQDIVNSLKSAYPYSAYQYSACSSYIAGMDTLSNGVLLLSKWPLSGVNFQPFPTYDYSTSSLVPGNYDSWAKKGILAATVDIGGLPLRIGISHALTGTEQQKSNWPQNYIANAITTFQLNGRPYIFALDNAGKAHIRRFEDYSYSDEESQTAKHGAGWTDVCEGAWSSDFSAVVSFDLNGHPYLFSLKSGSDQAYITRINDDPATGWQTFGPYFWDKDYRPTAITSFQLNGQPYIFGLKTTWDQAWVYRVNTYPETGQFNPEKPFEEFGPYPLSRYFGAITSFESNGHPWLYCLKSNDDQVYIQRINADPSTGKLNRTMPFTEFGPFRQQIDRHFIGETITTFQLNGRAYIFGVKSNWDQAWLYRINADPSTGLQSLGWYDWSRNYVAVESFQMNGHPYLFGLSGCCHGLLYLDRCGHWRPGEVFIKRIKDDGSGWEDLYQLEDLRMIRDATVQAQDGPPAIMMGDFNIHRSRYGLMDQLFRKAGAVDAYIEVHGTAEGGQTIDLANNKLAQIFCADDSKTLYDDCDVDDPRVPTETILDRIDYVYVKQSGTGLRVVPTAAQVLHWWWYTENAMDLSDHYPLAVQFRVDLACPVPTTANFDCDRQIGLADLSVLCSVWMTEPGDLTWDRACDMSNPMDDRIDMKDFEVMAQRWGTLPVHNITDDTWYMEIQTAIDHADDGDEIVVAPGTYYEAVNFKGKAITLHSADGPEVTILDATGRGASVVTCRSGEQADSILDGFTLTGGRGTTVGSYQYGGGMYNLNSSPTVTHCIFTANTLASQGGGMWNDNSNPTVTDCTFSNNAVAHNGGGMYNANSSPTVKHCAFTGNKSLSAAYGGGGMFNNAGSPVATDCTFSNNTANADGGGMYNYSNSSPIITNCRFAGNRAANYGGGMFNNASRPKLTNCILEWNTAQKASGGGLANYGSNSILINCTLYANGSPPAGGGIRNWDSTLALTNCIVWGNSPYQISSAGASALTVSYSNIQGAWTGTANINADPLFVDAAADDLRLSSGSPCTDKGSNAAVPPGITTDLDGNPRICDGDGNGTEIVDMGAYELNGSQVSP
jgi:endonuclease/exonuclease/phosphatase family metal-dependent hydrolase